MTQTCSLAILTSFLFLRLHYILKLVIGIIVVIFYSWNVWVYRSNLFKVILIRVFLIYYGICKWISGRSSLFAISFTVRRKMESKFRTKAGSHFKHSFPCLFVASYRSSGERTQIDKSIISSIIHCSYILTRVKIYSGRISEQIGLLMETSIDQGTRWSIPYEER